MRQPVPVPVQDNAELAARFAELREMEREGVRTTATQATQAALIDAYRRQAAEAGR